MSDFRYFVKRRIEDSILPFVLLVFMFMFFAWLIIKPVGMPLLWSVVLSYLAYPVYRVALSAFGKFRHSENLAASITMFVILLFIFIPLLFLGIVLTKESFRIYESLLASGIFSDSFNDVLVRFYSLPYAGSFIKELAEADAIPVLRIFTSSVMNWMTLTFRRVSSQLFGNAFKIFYFIAVIVFSSFFVVRDGHHVAQFIVDIMPLPKETSEDVFNKAAKMLRSVVYGVLLTAFIQGLLGGLGWWFTGLSNPVFFGFLMFITGMIPFVGTPSVWLPGSIALFASGEIIAGLMLLLWGIFVVSTVDNFIRPFFISEGTNVHVLVIFIGIIGGLYNWGIIGLFVGPVILSLGLFFLELYHSMTADRPE